MKKLLFLPLLVMVAMLASCSSDDDNNMPEIDSRIFTGKLLLNGSPVADGTRCELNVIDESASITLYGVQFAPTMPVMDITMPMLACQKSGDGYVINGKNVLPLVGGEPMDEFLISAVEASLVGDKFVVSAVTPMGTIGFSNALVTPVKPVGDARSFKGELLVGDFAKEVTIDVKQKLAGTLDIVINDAKFAANMPLTLDITLKDIPYEGGGDVTFAAENVAPYLNTETDPAPAYTFASVEGNVSGDKLSLNARMSEELAPYIAGKEFVFVGVETIE